MASEGGMVNGRLVIVVIGRNEGERLQRALASAAAERPAALVYVDSGSTDGSVERARGVGHGVIVQALDPARPFTAARGRNEGFERAIAQVPDAAYVQFLDGDCVLCEIAALLHGARPPPRPPTPSQQFLFVP